MYCYQDLLIFMPITPLCILSRILSGDIAYFTSYCKQEYYYYYVQKCIKDECRIGTQKYAKDSKNPGRRCQQQRVESSRRTYLLGSSDLVKLRMRFFFKGKTLVCRPSRSTQRNFKLSTRRFGAASEDDHNLQNRRGKPFNEHRISLHNNFIGSTAYGFARILRPLF